MQKTVTLQAEVAVTEMENGMRYVQVLPDDPRVGMVTPFVANGRGQMLSNGTFDFVQRKRIRRKPEFKGEHITLSFGQDGTDRIYFGLPNSQREEFAKIFQREAVQVMTYLVEMLAGKKRV